MSGLDLDQVKEAFSGKRGKILLIGGAAAIAYLLWTRRNGTPQEYPDDNGDGVPDGTHKPGTGTAPGGDSSNPATKPMTNEEWREKAVAYLTGRGAIAGDAFNAVTAALSGQPLTTQQYSWVSDALGALGTPPEGMPPLSHVQPTPTTKPATTPAKPPPAATKPKPAAAAKKAVVVKTAAAKKKTVPAGHSMPKTPIADSRYTPVWGRGSNIEGLE